MEKRHIVAITIVILFITILTSGYFLFHEEGVSKPSIGKQLEKDDFISNDQRLIKFLGNRLQNQTIEGHAVDHRKYWSSDLVEVGIIYRVDYGTAIVVHNDYFLLQKDKSNKWSLIAEASKNQLSIDDTARLNEWYDRVYKKQILQAKAAVDKKFIYEINQKGPSFIGYYGGTVERHSNANITVYINYWVEWENDKEDTNRLMRYIVKMNQDSKSNWVVESLEESKVR